MTSKFKRAAASDPIGSPSRIAVYRHIEQDIRTRVSAGPWAAGMMIPSRKNLAQEYGVDLRTVQRAIAALLSDGTLVAQGGRGTFVGQQLQMQSSNTIQKSAARDQEAITGTRLVIGVAVNQLVNPAEVAPRAISGAIHSAARQSSPEVRVLTLDSYADSLDAMVRLETEAFNVIEYEGLSGAIVWHSGGERTLLQLKRLVDKEIPLVLIDRYTRGLDCDFVGIDNVYSAIEAIRYLLSLGHVRIGFLAPLEQISAIDDRLMGYRKALSRAGIAPRAELEFRPRLADSLELASLKTEMERVVETIKAMPTSEAPTAIFAVNDVQAHHLINALVREWHFGTRADERHRLRRHRPFFTTPSVPDHDAAVIRRHRGKSRRSASGTYPFPADGDLQGCEAYSIARPSRCAAILHRALFVESKQEALPIVTHR